MGRLATIVDWTDVRRPTWSDVPLVFFGVIAYLVAAIAISALVSLFQTDAATHSTLARADGFDTSTLVYTFIVIWVFVAMEEYTFRNLLQKLLYHWMDYKWAIVLSSVVFASLHTPAYGGLATPAIELTLSLTLVFIGSVILGYAYWRTDNVVVSTLIHGFINTIALGVAVL